MQAVQDFRSEIIVINNDEATRENVEMEAGILFGQDRGFPEFPFNEDARRLGFERDPLYQETDRGMNENHLDFYNNTGYGEIPRISPHGRVFGELQDLSDLEDGVSPLAQPFTTWPLEVSREDKDQVVGIFPDICHKFLEQTYQMLSEKQRSVNAAPGAIAERLITQILDHPNYPKQEQKAKSKKRKRRADNEGDSSEERKWASKERPRPNRQENLQARSALLSDFPSVPLRFIDQALYENKNLFPAYEAIYSATITDTADIGTLKMLKKGRKVQPIVPDNYSPSIVEELKAARTRRQRQEKKILDERLDAEKEAALEKKAVEDGDMVECKCCFTEVRTAKTVLCSGNPCHSFCLECMKGTTKVQIELGRYKIQCMDTSGCNAGFTMGERLKFLDQPSRRLLERLEQQANIRDAEIEGLETCTQCDYAEIYPSTAVDRIFYCKNEDCEVISICRLCREDSHVPKTCEEHRIDIGVSERNTVAEAMTEALIRRCPKCEVATVKSQGCNKITCTKCGCHFCDVCNADITKVGYKHFDRDKKCPTSDRDLKRAALRVKEAGEAATAKLLAENPSLTEKDLEIKFSEAANKTPTSDYDDLQQLVDAHLANRELLRAAPPIQTLHPRHAEGYRHYQMTQVVHAPPCAPPNAQVIGNVIQQGFPYNFNPFSYNPYQHIGYQQWHHATEHYFPFPMHNHDPYQNPNINNDTRGHGPIAIAIDNNVGGPAADSQAAQQNSMHALQEPQAFDQAFAEVRQAPAPMPSTFNQGQLWHGDDDRDLAVQNLKAARRLPEQHVHKGQRIMVGQLSNDQIRGGLTLEPVDRHHLPNPQEGWRNEIPQPSNGSDEGLLAHDPKDGQHLRRLQGGQKFLVPQLENEGTRGLSPEEPTGGHYLPIPQEGQPVEVQQPTPPYEDLQLRQRRQLQLRQKYFEQQEQQRQQQEQQWQQQQQQQILEQQQQQRRIRQLQFTEELLHVSYHGYR